MSKKKNVTRRNFLQKGGSIASVVALMGGVEVKARNPLREFPTYFKNVRDEVVRVGLIGYGEWGREIAQTLGRNPKAEIAAVCDNFDLMLRRVERDLGEVQTYSDYRELLDQDDIPAVVIATPTHLHRDIAIDALEAGKHVYCEAPLASTVEDALAIAQAAREASQQIFQSSLLYRTHPQYRDVFQFIRSGAVGRAITGRTQWHAKRSWRRTSSTAERERELNWRLDGEISTGLMGEIGIHQVDALGWYINQRPVSVTGFGQLMHWRDGRDIPDTVQAIIEFPGGVHITVNNSLVTSFDGAYEMYYGSDSTIMLRDGQAWMFKEVDAPMLGWEVYARRDRFYREVGIALVADATQLEAQGIDPTVDDPNLESPIFYALDSFLDNNVFGPYPPAAGYQEGYEATVLGIKANEAVTGNEKVAIEESLLAVD